MDSTLSGESSAPGAQRHFGIADSSVTVRTRAVRLLYMTAIAGLAFACGPDQEPRGTAPAGDPTAATRTIVTFAADGSPIVNTEPITALEHQRELAAREAFVAGARAGTPPRTAFSTVDPGCAASSLWIFDNPGNTLGTFPFNHELCVFDPPPNPYGRGVNLPAIPRYCLVGFGFKPSCVYWATRGIPSYNSIASYWAGSNEGFFWSWFPNETNPSHWSFAPWERMDDTQANDWMRYAWDVLLFP
jgi:hypothetical protein